MRKKLKRREGERATFTGEFVRCGYKPGWRGPERTILLRDLRDARDRRVVEHMWFNLTKGFEALLPLSVGQRIRFDARVTKYEKGYKGRREDVFDAPIQADYRLSRPTHIHRIIAAAVQASKEESHG